MPTAAPETLRGLLQARGITIEAAGVLAGVNASTVSRIMNGHQRPQPVTTVRLARALGISAKRLLAMCDLAWASAHEGQDEAEWLPVA
jgi:transcriptional regulator with XRE-family HTH domain